MSEQMKRYKGWNGLKYGTGIIKEFCRNEKCDWSMIHNEESGYEDLETCPVCGRETNSSIGFGGLKVDYNRVVNSFTLYNPSIPHSRAYIDDADCQDAILFMMNHCRFEE